MASAAKERRYRSDYSVSGNLARDLDWDIRERELRHAGEAPRKTPQYQTQQQTRRRTAEKTETHVQVRERQQFSVLTAAAFALVLGLAVMVLMSYIRLTVLSAETVTLKNELSQLQTQNVSLTTQYERMFDMATVKAAAEEAGMAKPSNSQICYVDLSGGDSVVVYRQEEPNVLGQVLTSLTHGVDALVEYFS